MKMKLALFAMLLSITSTMAFGQTVSVNYNHSQSFAQYHTYAWQIDDPNRIANSILAQVAITDTDSALAGKGLSKVDISAKPDLIVIATGGLKQETSYNAWGMRGIGGGMGSITPQQNVEATLIVSLYDAKQKALIWRGIGEDTLGNNGDKNQKMVQNAINKMFKQWPK
jgi:hypothetical protein